MYLDAHVNKASYFNKVYLKEITIVTDEQMKESCSAAVEKNYIYKVKADTENETSTKKEIHLVLNRNNFNENFCKKNLSENMFFVYISIEGTPAPCTPCRLDEVYTIGVTFDYNIIYQQALGYMKELGDRCNIPMNFINFIMLFHALRIAIETDHYMPAIDYFYLLKGQRVNMATVQPCGCGG